MKKGYCHNEVSLLRMDYFPLIFSPECLLCLTWFQNILHFIRHNNTLDQNCILQWMSQGESGSNKFQIQQGPNFSVSLLITLNKIAFQVVGNHMFTSVVMYVCAESE